MKNKCAINTIVYFPLNEGLKFRYFSENNSTIKQSMILQTLPLSTTLSYRSYDAVQKGNAVKRTAYLFATVLLLLLLGAQSSFAGRHGVFLDLSSGSGESEWDSDTSSWDVDSDSLAVGYVFDSNPASSKVFNYRLNVGIVRHDLEDDFGDTLESTGIYAENIFGFAFKKSNNFRWWAGPLVRLGFYSGEIEEYDVDVDYVEFGLGLVTGMNFTADDTIISPSLGVRFSGYAGEGEYAGYSEDIEASATNIFFNLAILF